MTHIFTITPTKNSSPYTYHHSPSFQRTLTSPNPALSLPITSYQTPCNPSYAMCIHADEKNLERAQEMPLSLQKSRARIPTEGERKEWLLRNASARPKCIAPTCTRCIGGREARRKREEEEEEVNFLGSVVFCFK